MLRREAEARRLSRAEPASPGVGAPVVKSQRGGVFQSGGSGFSTWKLKLNAQNTGFTPRSGGTKP